MLKSKPINLELVSMFSLFCSDILSKLMVDTSVLFELLSDMVLAMAASNLCEALNMIAPRKLYFSQR